MRLAAADLGPGKIGLKIHFGERGNKTHIKPEWLFDAKHIFPQASFVECNVLYRGSRTVRKDHIRVAEDHGFGFLPIDILDGERGEKKTDVPVSGSSWRKAELGEGLLAYSRLIALSHFKGHMATGFGGALKNIGMGLGSRAGKLKMHSVVSPVVRISRCVGCGVCARDCPADAIHIGKKAHIDSGKCIGCAHCISVCPKSAVDIPWESLHDVNKALMENIVDYVQAALSGRRWWHINFIADVTYDCDCIGKAQKPFIGDVGIVASPDPVAADQASLDLVIEAAGGEDPFRKKHGVDGQHILEYAEKRGIGSRRYSLKRLT